MQRSCSQAIYRDDLTKSWNAAMRVTLRSSDIIRPSFYCLIVLLLSSCALPIHAATMGLAGSEDPASATPAYVPGEVIVNVDREAMEVIDHALANGTFPATGVASLDQALTASGAVGARLVFRDTPEDLEAFKAKFPDRVASMPQGSPSEASATYLVTLRTDASVESAVQALSGDPHVRYAQPNHVATMQTGAPQ
jgi:hypothetical protein